MDLESITGRMEVRTSVQNGDIPAAIEKVQQLDAEVRAHVVAMGIGHDGVRRRRRLMMMMTMMVVVLVGRLQMLNENTELVFHLKQQQLIELIRKGDVDAALEFAQRELSSLGQENVRATHTTRAHTRHTRHTHDTHTTHTGGMMCATLMFSMVGADQPHFLGELERTMALLAFDVTNTTSPVASLLEARQR